MSREMHTRVTNLLADADGAMTSLRIARGAILSANCARDHARDRIRYARSRLVRLRERVSVLTPAVLQEIDDGLAELEAAELDLCSGGITYAAQPSTEPTGSDLQFRTQE